MNFPPLAAKPLWWHEAEAQPWQVLAEEGEIAPAEDVVQHSPALAVNRSHLDEIFLLVHSKN